MLERETDHRFLGVISVDFIWIGWGKSWEIWKYGNGLDPPPKNLQSFQVIGQGVGGKDTLRLGLQIELRESEGFFFWVVNLQAMVCSCKSLAGAVMKVISHDKPCFFYSIFIVWSFRRSLFDRLGGRWCVCWCPKRRHGMARWHDGTGMRGWRITPHLRPWKGSVPMTAFAWQWRQWNLGESHEQKRQYTCIYICKYRQHELFIYNIYILQGILWFIQKIAKHVWRITASLAETDKLDLHRIGFDSCLWAQDEDLNTLHLNRFQCWNSLLVYVASMGGGSWPAWGLAVDCCLSFWEEQEHFFSGMLENWCNTTIRPTSKLSWSIPPFLPRWWGPEWAGM